MDISVMSGPVLIDGNTKLASERLEDLEAARDAGIVFRCPWGHWLTKPGRTIDDYLEVVKAREAS